jgi:hypothetical protein
VLETFLESIFLKHFQLFRRILNDVSSITKSAVPSVLIAAEKTSKHELGQIQESLGDAPVLSHCSLLRIP